MEEKSNIEMTQKIERIKELIPILNQASQAYYAEDREIMSNLEYDRLYDELVGLEKETGRTVPQGERRDTADCVTPFPEPISRRDGGNPFADDTGGTPCSER